MGGQGGAGEGTGGRKLVFHFLGLKIMKLCGDISLLLVRPELVLNQFFDDIFSEHRFFGFFMELYIPKFRDFFPMFFTINKSIFYEKKAGNPGISSETTRESRVRRPAFHS